MRTDANAELKLSTQHRKNEVSEMIESKNDARELQNESRQQSRQQNKTKRREEEL